MPNVTVKIKGGTDKENLQAIMVADKRWGDNGAKWGEPQDVSPGDEIPIKAFYQPGGESAVGKFQLENSPVTVLITADGPGKTKFLIEG